MVIRVVRLGSDRAKDEGLRIGTVRRPPRGVPKSNFSRDNWYDVWYPDLAPSLETMKLGQAVQSDADWKVFEKNYRREMKNSQSQHTLELLAKLSQQVNFSIGCYCENQDRCHRSILKHLLQEAGGEISSD